MPHREHAHAALKTHKPTGLDDFEKIYAQCRDRILSGHRLIRMMSPEEAGVWAAMSPPGASRMHVTPGQLQNLLNPAPVQTMHRSIGDRKMVLLKWFSLDRPYLFRRMEVNHPGGRDGQEVMMTLQLTHEARHTLIKKLIPDMSLQLPDEMRADACRGKIETGTVNLGIPHSLLVKMSRNLTIEHINYRMPLRSGVSC